MIGDLVPEHDVYYLFLLKLKEIVEMAFSFSLSTPLMSLFELKIQDHLQDFLDLFPDKSLLPKHHFLLHYGQAFASFGPLRLCWCMRFEAKHAYFKKLVRVINNFKNLLSTLAERHQQYQAYLTITEFGRSETFKTSKCTAIIVDNLSEQLRNLLSESGVNIQNSIHECQFVVIRGIRYCVQMLVVISFSSMGPVFGKITSIYMQDTQPRLLLRVCCCEWEPHFSAYRITFTADFKVVNFSNLFDYYPLSVYERNGGKFVTLKHFLFDFHDYANLM